jgi:acetyl-CoA acetyltransferase
MARTSSNKLNASLAKANAPSLVAKIINEPIALTSVQLCDALVDTCIATGTSLVARREAFIKSATLDLEATRLAFKFGHIAQQFMERGGVTGEEAKALALELQKKGVPARTATKFDSTRNENHVYVGAGAALNVMEIKTGFKLAPKAKGAKATTIEAVVKKDEQVTPTATTAADFIAWMQLQALTIAKYVKHNETFIRTTKLAPLADIATAFVKGVTNAPK